MKTSQPNDWAAFGDAQKFSWTKYFSVSLLIAFNVGRAMAQDPQIDSWFTSYSGRYARIYTSDAAKNSGTSVTTWSNGNNAQSLPAYCGVQEVYSSANWIYIRSTGFGSHTMGPWYLNAAHTQTFPGLPTNQKALFRIPRNPAVPVSKSLNNGGAIGYFVDGVAMFNSWDAFTWNGSSEVGGGGGGAGYWNRDAYVNEGVTFDPANAHQPGSGQYHYHANPPALRYFLGDHVDYNATTKTFTESTNAPTKHSPILGWVADGFPIYGPYGYSVATNSNSGVRRMISGYVLRNGQKGTQNLLVTGRTNLPQWAVRLYNISAAQSGPSDFMNYPLGRYMEDNEYLGDLGYTQGTDFDLDEYNGRFCVTPEFPEGTYAYFVAISSNGAPVFPYNIGRRYYGTPGGGAVGTISETVTTNFLGGPNLVPTLNQPTYNQGTITLIWSAVEGGTYRVESTSNLVNWTTNTTNASAILDSAAFTNLSLSETMKMFRVARIALATYDPVSGSAGGGPVVNAPGGSASRGSTVTVLITLPTMPPQPPSDKTPASITLGGISGTSISRPSQDTAQATFTIPANASLGAQNIVIIFNPAPTYTMTGAFTITE